MVDILVELDDREIHTLLRRAEQSSRSLNDEMLSILEAAAAEEADTLDEADEEQGTAL